MKHKFYYMKRALKLARRGLFTTSCNPRVGCILIKNNRIIGQGYHQYKGQKHAEAIALEHAGDEARGSTAYVTLEPCSHTGDNPPCAELLIRAGITKVVICNNDPNPLVDGQGIAKLQAAGIPVETGIHQLKGYELNCGFLHRMKTGLPFVRVKMAQSLDGRTAMKSGESYWITSKKARRDVQYWRARSGAILTGIETVLADDCQLTVRPKSLPKKYRKLPHDFDQQQPMRVILDTQLRVPLQAKILHPNARRVIFTCSQDKDKIRSLRELGVEIENQFCSINGKIDLSSVLKWLGNEQINEVLVEAGATLAGQFVQQNLVQQLIVYTAPVLMGSSARPLLKFDIEEMQHRLHINDFQMKRLGKDWRLIANL